MSQCQSCQKKTKKKQEKKTQIDEKVSKVSWCNLYGD